MKKENKYVLCTLLGLVVGLGAGYAGGYQEGNYNGRKEGFKRGREVTKEATKKGSGLDDLLEETQRTMDFVKNKGFHNAIENSFYLEYPEQYQEIFGKKDKESK